MKGGGGILFTLYLLMKKPQNSSSLFDKID